MADDNNQKAGVKIPQDVQDRFPDLVKMVIASESMDNEERKYWFSVLPIMTQSQIAELRDILETEKKKLAEIDAKYSNAKKSPQALEMSEEDLKKAEEERAKGRMALKAKEAQEQKEAEENAEALLDELDNL